MPRSPWTTGLSSETRGWIALSDDAACVELSATMPQKYVDAFFKFYVDGTFDQSIVYPTVQEIGGRPPRSFRAWAEAHAAAFV